MIRTARCCCGTLQIETSGEPSFVVAGHCVECLRRTGSVFGVGAYFSGNDMRTYRCDRCEEEHIMDFGIATWKAMSGKLDE
jgi:hypothetical protein